MSEIKTVKTGKAMANLADKWFAKRAERLILEKQVETMKSEESQLKAAIIKSLVDAKISSVGGKLVSVAVVRKEKPTVEDWEKLYAYIKKTESFDLLQRRLSETAVNLRWEDEIKIPGVTSFPIDELSYSKVK